MLQKYGRYALIAALALAVIVGLIPSLHTRWVTVAFVMLGLVAGVVSVFGERKTEFLMATIALMLVGSAGLDSITTLGKAIGAIMSNIRSVAAPAALVASLAILVTTAREQKS